MIKCRDYEMYYGIEKKKHNKTKAETIVDVIYEAIYDVLKGIKLENEMNTEEEQKYFKFQRLNTLNGESEIEK